MVRSLGVLVSTASFLLLGAAAPVATRPAMPLEPAEQQAASPEPAPALIQPEPAKPAPPKPPTVTEALADGVLIVVSIPAQRIFVFKDGEDWGSAPVSTGKRSKPTPTGVFPILQKQVFHRSNLYDDAPMPYMQRLTWGGVALHAGYVPGHPASHGCIRLPRAFAKKLYGITSFRNTAVLVTDTRLASADDARRLGGGLPARPDKVRLAAAPKPATPTPAAPAEGPVQTIQLAAAPDAAGAESAWAALSGQHPLVSQLDHRIIPATVNARQVYRLRASGPGAHAICTRLEREGVSCWKVSA